MGTELGVRETRRIEGEYVLTLEDSQEGKHFDDVVAKRYGTIDPGGLKEDKDYHGSIKNGHDYPYRCMLPYKATAASFTEDVLGRQIFIRRAERFVQSPHLPG